MSNINNIPRKELYHSILPSIGLILLIVYTIFIFDPYSSSHIHTGSLVGTIMYIVFISIIITLSSSLYMTWYKNKFWLTKIINILMIVVITSAGSLMAVVYLLDYLSKMN